MLYCVSFSNGTVGIFSSIDKVKELIFDKYPSITFITQVFKNSKDIQYVNDKHIAWAVIYKNSETYAYVSDNKEECINACSIFDKIGKVYEDSVEYYELEVDVVPECTSTILSQLQRVYGEAGSVISSMENIISYV